MTEAILLENIFFKYANTPVLEDLTLKILKGDFVALLGHNGSGKSTLLKISLGLLKPDRGVVKLDGVPASAFRDWHKIGYVQQVVEDFDFQFPATVEEIVQLGRMNKTTDSEKIDYAIKTIGLEHLRKKKIGELSGGQRQKVFLAKALASEAEILFLDEPTTGVDYASQHKFYDLLQDLNTNLGITIVLVTHDVGQIIQHAKKIIVLNKKIVFEGESKNFSKENLLTLIERI